MAPFFTEKFMETIRLQLVHVDKIKIKPERQRSHFDKEAIEALYHRIVEDGLLHPPGIDTLENSAIVYGERRFRCMRTMAKHGIPVKYNSEVLPVGMIPVNLLNETDVLKLEELELSENSDRQDLTWQEKARALARIKEIIAGRKQREQEAKAESDPDANDVLPDVVVTQAEVAQVFGTAPSSAGAHLSIVNHLDDPDVAKAKSLKDAVKIVEKKAAQAHRERVAATTVVNQSQHKIFKGDVRDVIKTVPSDTFRAIVTDPPYGIEMHKDQSWDGTWHEYNDDEAYCFNLFEALIPEWDRITLDAAHLYAFCDFAKFEKIRSIFDSYRVDEKGKVGFLVTPECALQHNLGIKESKIMLKTKAVFEVMYFPFIWNKGNVASYPKPNHWPRKSYECLLYAIKGGHEQAKLDLAVIDIPQIQNQKHPAGKPTDLYKFLIERSTLAGEYVFDGFAGQGNMLRAAHASKRISYSVELSDTYYPMLVEAYNECQ